MQEIIGIICATKSERDAILKRYKKIKIEKIYDMTFYIFKIKNVDVVMVQSGVGKINATRATQVLIDKYNASFVINYGTVGSINRCAKESDIVIATACVQADADCTAFGVEKGKFNNEDELYIKVDEKIIYKVKDKLKDVRKRVLYGKVATLDQFVVDYNENKCLRDAFDAICTDMESVATAIVCKSCNIPFLIIKSISNSYDDEDLIKHYEETKDEVSNSIVEVIRKIIN